MIVSSLSLYAAVAFAPAASSAPAVRKTAEASEPPPAPLQPAAALEPDEEAALRERYFEEMISSAADLLLRSQMGLATRFDP